LSAITASSAIGKVPVVGLAIRLTYSSRKPNECNIPTTIVSYSIVGEKVSRSLEPLLSTPTTDGEILVGKGLAAFIPTVFGMWAGPVLFQVLIDLEARGALGYLYFPNRGMAILRFVLMPLAAFLAIEASVVISSHVTGIRSAQQYASLIFLPLMFLYIASEIVLTLNAVTLLYMALGLAVVVFALFVANLRTFHAEQILTRWK
jgi:ABC-2 type transport system permease protein